MLKGVIKYLLFLSIILISGYQHISAHTFQTCASTSSDNQSNVTSTDFPEEGTVNTQVKTSGASVEELKLDWRTGDLMFESEEEEEDDEHVAHKKRIKDQSQVSTGKVNQTPEYLFRGNKRIPSASHNTVFNHYQKYLILQVLRL